MKEEDITDKLENLTAPQIELSRHRQALKTALISSRHYRRRTALDWARILAPVTAAVVLIALLGLVNVMHPADNDMSRFASYQQLKEFLAENSRSAPKSMPGLLGGARIAGDVLAPAPAPPSPSEWTYAATQATPDYSTTNIQVAGVDEADIVKTDGEYIYVVSENTVIIVKAYPAEEAGIVSEIELEGIVAGIFIDQDRLVVIEGGTPYYRIDVTPGGMVEPDAPYIAGTSIKIYDVSDRADPSLQREVSASGYYISSRMIGHYAYVVVNEPAYQREGELILPGLRAGDEEIVIPATVIYYYDGYDYFYRYTTIIAINTHDDAQEPTVETALLGASSSLYVSPGNIYLTFPVWGSGMRYSHKTTIHRIHIDGDAIEYVASGEVPGKVLNQFSMDEYEGYFRVATTTNQGFIIGVRLLLDDVVNSLGAPTDIELAPSLNHVYVLDMEELNIVGSVQDLAPGERIHSARFMGTRAYLVTYEVIDPLFVLDLQDPRNPRVLGELKITGYSDYLHPYDENHLIGIGKETVEAEEGGFSWMQGVKISLFDVSDVSNPQEVAKYEIGHRGTESPVLTDHKALLFDRARNLMVMPVCVAEIREADYAGGVRPWTYSEPVWQGAYVFHVSPEQLTPRGQITHFDAPPDEGPYYYCRSPLTVQRSLYIGDVLYTISQAKIKMNDLQTLDEINELKLT